MKTAEQNTDLLYIEDNEDYINFVGLALKDVDNSISYGYVTDGLEAKALLEANDVKGSYSNTKLILLDYNLPGMNGIQLLQRIRKQRTLMHTPVVIFSSSNDPMDIKKAYDNGANAYIIKPIGLKNLTNTIKTMCEFWIHKNQFC
ncbi:MAG: response regulator [Rhizobacter sp.]|nr:response regulator [Ferruginibacter sp.]